MSYKQPQKDFFSMELHTPGGQPLPSIEYDGHRWFVGEPGQEFVVHLEAKINSGMTYRVSLTLDGQGPGYTKLFYGNTKSCTDKFQGWLTTNGSRGEGTCSESYKLFKFGSCRPSQGAATVSNPDDIQAGRIELQLTQVVDSGRRQALQFTTAGPSNTAANKKLPEGKKWFLAPGLKAEAGAAIASTTSWNTTIWDTVGSLPDIKVRYDSSEALYLRKALNPRFAPHRAILRKSANPAIAALGAEAAPGAAAAAGRGGSSQQQDATAHVKREAGVKRERQDDDDEFVPRSATAAHRVDLTEEPVRPMTVNGQQLAPDELAVCDLCDSDEDDAPTWQVKKKQQIEVEV